MENSKYRKSQKIRKILNIVLISIFLIAFATFAYGMITDKENIVDYGTHIISAIVGIAVLSIPFLIIFANWYNKNYQKKLKETKQMQRFIYLDTFYYVKTLNYDDSLRHKFYSYYVLQDMNTKKIYAISGEIGFTNVNFQYVLGKASIWTGKGLRFLKSSNWKEVSFNSEGSLWIEEEIPNYLTFDGEKVIFDGINGKEVLKNKNEIGHCNSMYDFSLLENATFVTGYAEFDTNN